MKITPVANLKQQASHILAELHTSKEPVLITEEGKSFAYLVAAEDFETMQQRIALLEALAQGEQDITEGKINTHAQVTAKFSKWLA